MKVYVKRGAPNDRERKLVSALQKVINQKIAEDPNFKFTPARNWEELQKYHTEYCTETIQFEQDGAIFDADGTPAEQAGLEEERKKKIKDLNIGDEEDYDTVKKLDNAMLRGNPKVRDYVLDDDGISSQPTNNKNTKTNFAEPTSFDESFQLPGDEEESPSAKGSGNRKEKKEKKPPINPAFDDMDASKQRKKTKLFARYIVEGVCTLAEKGFVWFATKDISEAKLVEYEISGEINMQLLISLDETQEATVKEWFLIMNKSAEQLAVINQEDRDSLAEALAEVMMENGVAPTPMQNLLIVAAKVFIIDKGIALLSHKMQTSSVLVQLREMRKEEIASNSQEIIEEPKMPENPAESSPEPSSEITPE